MARLKAAVYGVEYEGLQLSQAKSVSKRNRDDDDRTATVADQYS
jgi:hypothetical protein